MKPHIALREAIKAGEYDANLDDLKKWVKWYIRHRRKALASHARRL
jgi:hypothetical protein